ncbi:MAG: TIGR03862 family flavoprotein [Methylacidiphilales bacterium]|nr:TIGR03862 family flavoprotein [Candidatus Methylacidiphilales bacterium]
MVEGKRCDVLVVGGGPAGLRAAELVSASGLVTVLADHKPSVGRKFLVAGRGGLNLTHSEPIEQFPRRYGDATVRWQGILASFSPADLRQWAENLGIKTFVGTSGRVFPMTKQAAPLLRRWLSQLRRQGVVIRPRHRLIAFRRLNEQHLEVAFDTPEGRVTQQARALVLALGGASWPQTGSDGEWIKLFAKSGIAVHPLVPANCGYEVDWLKSFLHEAEGLPLKNIVVRAGKESVAGELFITKYGLEGGAIYQLGRFLRAMATPEIIIDLKPAFTAAQLAVKLGPPQGSPLLSRAVKAWKLGKVAGALLKMREPFASTEALARLTKAYPLPLLGPRPIEEAISSAGGVSWDELDDDLMLKRWPGIFCAGEMIDWEAPTGGYLLQGCFSTATCAARGVVRFFHHES